MALAKRLHASGDMSAREIADEAGVSASTMYRPLRIETAAVLFSGLTVSP
ncbi:helix-turn-helix domain-containing protein [Micrococcus luteus]|nr:helix-turn-helix domain-containing protein [Micrococcus luteus]